MAFLNKLLMSSLIRAQKSRDPKEIKARQQASGGFLKNIDKSQLRKAIMDGAPDRNRGPKTGFGGFGMAGGAAVLNVKGERSGLPPTSLAEILAQRNIQFNPFQSSKQGLPQKMPQVQPAPPMQEPAKPQPEMVNFLSKLVQQGVYPDLATAFRATMQQPQQPSNMGGPAGGPMGDRGPSGIASMMPFIAGRLFGGR